jgi:hypothetical protein
MSVTIEDEMRRRSQLVRACCDCGNVPCVWETDVDSMVLFLEAQNEEEATPKERRHSLYRQMALIINDGPSGHGNRVRLPNCVFTGVRELYPDPGAVYTGHREKD